MCEQPLNHWASFLPDFLPTSGMTRELANIKRDDDAIAWLKQQISDTEKRIEERVLLKYSPEEIEAAKGKFLQEQSKNECKS